MKRVTQRWRLADAAATRRLKALQPWVLPVVWMLAFVGQTAAFDKQCGVLSTSYPPAAERFSSVVPVHTVGRATGTYMQSQEGVSQWHLGSGDFTITGRGFVVGQFVVTAAHVVYPSDVEIQIDQHTTTSAPVVAVQRTSVYVGGPVGKDGVPAEVVHLNHHFDLALLRLEASRLPKAFPYPTSATWWRETPGEASSLLRAGDCVVALMAARDGGHTAGSWDENRAGNVVAPYAVSAERSVVAGLSPNTVTISTPAFPGDSGSPVVAFDAGTPRLVGVVTATRHPFEALSYISRIDALLPILIALRGPAERGAWVAQAK